jgi:PAS domain-containing protein
VKLPRLPFRLPSISPIARITIGLVSLSLSLIIGFDIAFGLFPKETDTARQIRQRISQSLAVQATMGLGDKDFAKLERLLNAVVKRDPDLLSAGLRKDDGTLRLAAGPHAQEWKPVDPSRSTLEHVSIPMFDQDKAWGRLELSFRPVGARDGAEWLQTPSIKLFAVFLVMGSTVFYFYLRRVLQKLDPSKAVPDRVRLAFDTLSEGLLILDGSGRIMMVNQSLLTISGVESADVLGKTVDQLSWLRTKEQSSSDNSELKNPWATAIRERRFVQGELITKFGNLKPAFSD